MKIKLYLFKNNNNLIKKITLSYKFYNLQIFNHILKKVISYLNYDINLYITKND